ncbi:MAG: Omp28 family outer membrane lipoprotein [Prevotellaceae bacterium]|nr:Omp28 family outer membrane lipoprotein [Prevotellaceae bacterium]
MNLKNILLYSPVVLAVAAFTACSNIDEDVRYVYVEPAEVSRAVLIEDFTGQACVNCPNATDEIESIIETYGDSAVIAVGIHSGPLGFRGNSRYVGLATDLGDEYYSHWGLDHQPVGVINRVSGAIDYTSWRTSVYEQIQKEAGCIITADNSYDEATRTATINVETYSSGGTINGYLQVWLTEDSIVAMQSMPNGSIDYSYVHNHVLRDAVNGTWGEAVTMAEGDIINKSYTYQIPEDWVADNMSAVIFVYDNSNGVYQVIKKSLINKE